MITREGCYHEHCMTKFRNKFRKFPNDQENHIKEVQKSLEAFAVAECMSFIEDSPQSSDEVAPFIKLSVMRKFYYYLENLKTPVVSVNATRLTENLLKLSPYLEAASRKKEVFFIVKLRILYGIKFLKKIGISPAVSVIIVRLNQFQLHFFP